MDRKARAHFDGSQVVLDEPAPFGPGEQLIVIAAPPAGPPPCGDGTGDGSRRDLSRGYQSLEEMLADIPPPPAGESDLWEIIAEERANRRRAVQDSDPDELGWMTGDASEPGA